MERKHDEDQRMQQKALLEQVQQHQYQADQQKALLEQMQQQQSQAKQEKAEMEGTLDCAEKLE